MNNFVLGQYIPGDTFLYKLDPRCKIISSILLMVAIFFLENTYLMLGYIAVLSLILALAKISLIKVFKGLKAVILLSLFIFAFQIFFNQTGDVVLSTDFYFSWLSIAAVVVLTVLFFVLREYVSFKTLFLLLYIALLVVALKFINYPEALFTWNLNIYKGGVTTAIYVFFRMVALIFTATVLTLTTKPTDLTLAIEWMFKPLKVFKINSEEIALIITIALRYIPTILEEAQKIMDAQASRGADFKSGNLFKKIKQLLTLLVPMFVISFERSDELADAMMTRNFVPGMVKTKYHKLKWMSSDTIALILVLLLLGGSICLYVLL